MLPSDMGQTSVQVLVSVFGPELLQHSLHLIAELRNAGLRCELYYSADPLGAQIRYALKKGIPFVAIVGPDEQAAGQVTVRDLRFKSQTQVLRSEAARVIKEQVAGSSQQKAGSHRPTNGETFGRQQEPARE